ncbi:MAG TPA: hypothetical protein VHC90_05705 [Bryobacteraceae bacterium]|nr:hypothetical protein [Bryobacteraceae bacterium]
MDEPDLLNDIRFLRRVVTSTRRAAGLNRRWTITLAWGMVISAGYVICAVLAANGRASLVPWVMPALIFLVGWPLHLYLSRQARLAIESIGVRPEPRRDLLFLWLGILAVGLLWVAFLVASGLISTHGYLLIFAWCSLHLIGYIMNGVLLSGEWFLVAGVVFAGLVAVILAGPACYWYSGIGIPASYLLIGLIGFRNARRQTAAA